MRNRLALCDVSGPLTDLLQKLSGENGGEWQRALAKMLRKENPWEVTASDLKIWKSIKLGTTGYKIGGDFHRALIGQGFKVSNWAKDILGKPQFAVVTQETEVDLVVISIAELGFKEGATRQDIYQRAQELGLAFCPAEVGPQLRLQYKDQPHDESLFVAMEPITDSVGNLRVFYVGNVVRGLWLDCYHAPPDYVWYAGHRWVFCLRKPARNA